MVEQDTNKFSFKGSGGDKPADDQTLIKSSGNGEENTPSRPQYEPPYFVIIEGPRSGTRFPLLDGRNTIGRAPDCNIRLEDQSVSRQHAEASKGESGWTIRDLGSKNGTSVNGKPIAETVVIGHKDIVKTGIYHLRLITQKATLEEEMTLPPEMLMPDRTVFVAAPPDGLTAAMRKKDIEEEGATFEPQPPAISAPGEVKAEDDEGGADAGTLRIKLDRRQIFKIALVAILGIAVIATVAFFASRMLFKSGKKKIAPAEEAQTEVTPPESETDSPPVIAQPPPPPVLPEAPQAQPSSPQTQPEPVPASVRAMPVFLDITTSPMPAKVTFQEKELGNAPLRINVELEAQKSYEVYALFTMPEISQQYTQTLGFTVEGDKSIIPLFFRAPIGFIRINDLPRDVQFYLEGKFSYDKFQEQSAKLNEIVLRKPIYVPYGAYVLELRRSRQMGETSQTFISDIIFHREFTIAEESPKYELEVTDEDLKLFPAKIRSEPANAEVFIDGKPVGKTPYEGNIPLGEHKLALRKEGYFEHGEDLKVDINTPFVAEITLKTSTAGTHINNAKLAINRAMYQDAINELAEALNNQPAPAEIGLINYLLGICYMQAGDLQRAASYFDAARQDETQKHLAMLGLANVYAAAGRLEVAIPLLVEVLLGSQDENTKREANTLFQKISPFRSILYIYSDPPGAQVTVNDKPVAQTTPMILHEMPLGNYRIHIEKTGYLPVDLNFSLSVNEFKPVVVKLKPIPQ